MATHLIHIDVDLNGSFSYTPSTLRAAVADTIRWESPKHFALMFLDKTPIAKMEVHADVGSPTPPFSVSSGAQGHYHYAVAVWNGSRVIIDSGCPDIVVN